MLGSEPLGNLKFYEYSIFDKQTRVKFSKSHHTTTHALDYVHSDWWSPAPFNPQVEICIFCPSLMTD